jgi:hypothetical protein
MEGQDKISLMMIVGASVFVAAWVLAWYFASF